MTLKCIIIDDEPLAIDLLKSYVLKTSYLELVGTFNSALSAISTINERQIDLLFLDINMPQINGLEFSKTIHASTRIIFTTAYDQYAVEGFRVNALDYLLKPINYTDFLQATNKALEWFKLANISHSTTSLFMRVHRSFIVNLKKIKTIERNCIVFGKEYIPVSESYKNKFMDFLNKHFF